MTIESIKKYYGFAKKSGSVAVGTDKIACAKNVYLIIVSSNLAENAQKRLQRKAERNACEIVIFKDDEFRIFEPNESILAVGIKNAELVKAMQK